MRLPYLRPILFAFIFMAVSVMTAAAGTVPVYELTMTVPPPITPTPTPTGPPPMRREQPPTPIERGRIYEGNYFGVPVEFLLDAELGQAIILELTRADFDAVLEINDATGTQVGYDDDSGVGNMPMVLFIAPSTGTFTVRLRAFSDPQEGSYILRVHSAVANLRMGEASVMEFDGTSSVIYGFNAAAGDVVNIVAVSDDRVDTTLRLIRPDGSEVIYNDDFSGIDPEIRRQPLDVDGRYYLIHAPYSSSSAGTVTLYIEQTEVVTLSAEPAYFEIEAGRDIFNLNVEAGQLYLVTLTARSEMSGTVDATGLDGSSAGSVSFSNVEGTSLIFRADTTGQYRLNTTVYNPESGIYLSIRPVNQ